jgi:nucleoid DNA-binding protein
MRVVKQVRATFSDALWADFVTHANARYIDALTKLASLASVGTFSVGVQAVREGEEPECGERSRVWIV